MANGTNQQPQDWREAAWQRERQADPQNLQGKANAPLDVTPPKTSQPAQPLGSDPNDIASYLNMYTGPSGQALNVPETLTYLRAQDPKLFSKRQSPEDMAKYMKQIATSAQWQPNIYGTSGTGGTGDTGNVLDPIGVQQFYAQTIAPFIGQIAGSENWVTQQYQNMANQSIPGLPASYNAALQANARSMGLAGQNAFNTMTTAAANQPQVDSISNQLANIIRLKTQGMTQQAKLAGAQGATAGTANIISGLG